MPIPPDDVTLNKAAIIERSIRRMREEYAACPGLDNFTHVDALTLNLERACQAAIDLAMHGVAHAHLGMPQSSADAFVLLGRAGRISDATVRAMVAMTGFRNVAIHEYRDLDLGILRTIVEGGWTSLVGFCAEMGTTIRP